MTTATVPSADVDCLRRMVTAATLAPSAENTQPWRFLVEDERLLVGLDRTRILASDVDSMLDLTSIGAALENAVIASRQAGYEPSVTYLPEGDAWPGSGLVWPAAELQLEPGGEADPLYEVLGTRCTSRRMESRPVARDALEELTQSARGFEGVRVDWVTDRCPMRQLAQLVGVGNRIRFEHRPFHAEFYHNMRFSPAEVQSGDGLDVATLQLPLGVAGVLRLMRSWGRICAANWLGFSRAVGRQASQETFTSGALGVLTVETPSADAFLRGGRALERIWLAATAAGLGLHPAASLAVFLAYARRTDGARLLPGHRPLVRQMNTRFDACLPHLAGRTVQMVFRLGYADRPPVRSRRRAVDEVMGFSQGDRTC